VSDGIPILKVDDILIVSIQQSPTDRMVGELQINLMDRIVRTRAIGVIVDVTAIDLVDSYFARSLNETALAASLVGAEMVVVGIRPTVAIPLVKMGLSFQHATTALDLEEGLALLRSGGQRRRGDRRDMSHLRRFRAAARGRT